MIDLSVVVLNYNGVRLLPECLEAISAQRWPDARCEVLVVDNGSTSPPSAAELWDLHGARLVSFPDNLGNIGGTNRCYASANGEYVLFLANDVRLRPEAVSALWDHRTIDDISQPVLWQPDGRIDNVGIKWCWPGYGARVRVLGRPVDAFANTCHLMKKTTWATVGGFDASLGISHEDVDFSLKARAYGYTIGYCPDAHATHLMGQTIGKVVGRPLSPYYRKARKMVVERHYRGLDRLTRRLTVAALDGLAARMRPR